MARGLTPAEMADTLPVADTAGPEYRRARSSLAHDRFREYWKYTPVKDFVMGLGVADVQRPVLAGAEQAGIRLQSLADLPAPSAGGPSLVSAERFPLADLACLLAGDALVIQITGEVADPLSIRHGDGLAMPVFLRLDRGASLTLSETFRGTGFGNQSLYIDLAHGASLTHAVTAFETDACHWSLTQVRQAEGSRYQRQQYCLGGRKRRVETHVLLEAPQAEVQVTGAWVVDGGTHLDQQLIVEHRAAATRSRQRLHGIGAGKGTAVFNGRIHIHPHAPGADAALTNRNLALHADAVINTKPELEIYTDDVRCAHGATVGQLSEESLFYLRSRGLDPRQARRMLCRAFIRECLEGPLAAVAEPVLLGNLAGAE